MHQQHQRQVTQIRHPPAVASVARHHSLALLCLQLHGSFLVPLLQLHSLQRGGAFESQAALHDVWTRTMHNVDSRQETAAASAQLSSLKGIPTPGRQALVRTNTHVRVAFLAYSTTRQQGTSPSNPLHRSPLPCTHLAQQLILPCCMAHCFDQSIPQGGPVLKAVAVQQYSSRAAPRPASPP
jgi:hypothetical protein